MFVDWLLVCRFHQAAGRAQVRRGRYGRRLSYAKSATRIGIDTVELSRGTLSGAIQIYMQ